MTQNTEREPAGQLDKVGDGLPLPEAERTGAEAEAEVDFEASLKALEALVKQMESGELGLEESLVAFERGVKLTRRCQAALRHAELRVQALTDRGEFKDLDVGNLADG